MRSKSVPLHLDLAIMNEDFITLYFVSARRFKMSGAFRPPDLYEHRLIQNIRI